jgi:hypothetical protein
MARDLGPRVAAVRYSDLRDKPAALNTTPGRLVFSQGTLGICRGWSDYLSGNVRSLAVASRCTFSLVLQGYRFIWFLINAGGATFVLWGLSMAYKQGTEAEISAQVLPTLLACALVGIPLGFLHSLRRGPRLWVRIREAEEDIICLHARFPLFGPRAIIEALREIGVRASGAPMEVV